MRIIHGKGYTGKDRAEFAGLVYRNIILAAQLLAEAMLSLKIQYETEDNKVRLLIIILQCNHSNQDTRK